MTIWDRGLFVGKTALCSDGDAGVDESQGGAGDG